MPLRQTLKTLLETTAHTAREAAAAQARSEARQAWTVRTIAALKSAQKRADEAWMRHLDRLEADGVDEEEWDALPPPPEQAAVDAIWAELNAVRERDLWPRELYWSL